MAMAELALKFRPQCRMMELPDCGVGIEMNTDRPEKPPISGGSNNGVGRVVAAQVDANGVQWVVREPIPS